MLKNYLKITLRNVFKSKSLSLINLGGMAVGIASSLLILLYVLDELSYDRFHHNHEDIYRVTAEMSGRERYATTPPTFARALRSEIPEVKAAARVLKWNDYTMRFQRPSGDEVVFRETNAYYTDADFFRIFDFELLAGDPAAAFADPLNLVLTASTTKKYFGEKAFKANSIVGQSLLIGTDRVPFKIVGIINDPPQNSHIQFDILVSFATLPDLSTFENWQWNIMHTYVQLNKSLHSDANSLAVLEAKLSALPEKYAADYAKFKSEGGNIAYRLQPITDIHLHSHLLREMQPNGNFLYLTVLSLIAFSIILLACVNFINLTTARANERLREIGIRKALGSQRLVLIWQFILEAIFHTFLAALLAVALIELCRGPFNMLSGKSLTFHFFENWRLSGTIFLGVVFIGLLAGGYPAWMLSRYREAEALSGRLPTGAPRSRSRSLLVVMQFAITITLIACTLIIKQQLDFNRSKDLGFDRENVVVIQNDREIVAQREAFKQALKGYAEIVNAGFATGMPANSSFQMRSMMPENSSAEFGIYWYEADTDYLPTLKIEMLAGRNFSRTAADNASGVVINETAAQTMGFEPAASALGAILIRNKGANDEARLHIIGVMQDHHFESLHHEIKPLAIEYLDDRNFRDYIAVRLAPGDVTKGLKRIEQTWHTFEPDIPLTWSFLDREYDALFRAETRLEHILSVFAGLAILIACLGLLGLVIFTASRRTKEIGIRKVLGASVTGVVYLLTKDFVRLVLIANLIAWPIAWYVMNWWLQGFAYRIEIGWWIFALAGGLALLIALLTVSTQAIRAALANPVEALRYE
ncbi:MAG: ABC transporter permease [bacterium]